jgi:2-methylcitrate dehydratase PrpD
MATPVAFALAEWSATVTWESLPTDLQERVRLWLLDTIGLMVAGSTFPPGRAVLEMVRSQGGSPEATLVGERAKVPAAWAAFAHGSLAHSLDYDDTFPVSLVHPGSLVVPTALATGEAVGADGASLGAAIAAGYEVAARLGAVAGRAFHARGFQATSVVGPLVAAVVAAKLYGLSPRTTAEAMGLAGSMGGGLLEFLSDGSWSKRLHPGWAAHGGIVAARLAAGGFPGPLSILEGRHGLYAAFLGARRVGIRRVLDGLGRQWLAREAQAKLYPCAYVIHPFLDAARTLREQPGFQPEEVDSVVCHVAPWAIPIACEPHPEKVAPRTEYQARASLPFCVAAILTEGRVDMDTFTPERVRAPGVLALAARVIHRRFRLRRGDEGVLAGRLELRLRTGKPVSAAARMSRAPDPAALRGKFAAAGRRLPLRLTEALLAAVTALPATAPAALLSASAGCVPAVPPP